MRLALFVRPFVPAAIVGTWSGLLWHWYVVELGLTIGAWQRGGPFELITTCAIGLGALLVTFAIVYEPEAKLATARVPTPWQRVGFRALAVLGMLSVLALIDRVVVRPPAPVPAENAELFVPAEVPPYVNDDVSRQPHHWCFGPPRR